MYFVYVLRCAEGTLYTGITNDLRARLKTHAEGKGSKYVRAHLPFILVYSEAHESKSAALKREIEIKSWNRERKLREFNLLKAL